MVVEMTVQGQMQKMSVLILGMMTKMTARQMKSWTMSLRREQRQQRSGAGPTATPPPATAKGREKRGLTVQRQAITRRPPSRAHLPRSWQPEVPKRVSSRYALKSPVFQSDGQGNCTGEAFIVLHSSFKPIVLLSFSGSTRSATSALEVLQASKTLKKRKVEEVEAAKADREAKALKREMRRKGHLVSIKLLHITPSCKLLCRRVQCTRSLPRLAVEMSGESKACG